MVKTNNCMFLGKPLNRGVTYFCLKRVQDVFLADVMPKRRLVELNGNIHNQTIALHKQILKAQAPFSCNSPNNQAKNGYL